MPGLSRDQPLQRLFTSFAVQIIRSRAIPPIFSTRSGDPARELQQKQRARGDDSSMKKLTDIAFGFSNMGTGKDFFLHSTAVQGVRFMDHKKG